MLWPLAMAGGISRVRRKFPYFVLTMAFIKGYPPISISQPNRFRSCGI